MRSVIRPRKEWTNRPIDRRCSRQDPKKPILFIHYSDSKGRNLLTKRQQVATVAAIWDYHVNTNGWYDIGYSYILCQPWGGFKRARVWRGRGRGYVPASQQGYNNGNLSVCVVADNNDNIKDATLTAIVQLARELRVSDIRAHRDVNDTDCPGDRLAASIPQLKKRAGL